MIPATEQHLLETTIAAASAAAARNELFAGAAQLYVCLKRAQRLCNAGEAMTGRFPETMAA